MSSMTRLASVVLSSLVLLAGTLAVPTVATADPPARLAPIYEDFTPERSDPKALRQAWRRWLQQDTASYVLRVKNYCFCPDRPPIDTTVSDGKVTSVKFQGRAREMRRKGYDMDRMFLILRDAYAEADVLRVKYSKRGVPFRIAIDWSFMIADEEANYTVQLRGLD